MRERRGVKATLVVAFAEQQTKSASGCPSVSASWGAWPHSNWKLIIGQEHSQRNNKNKDNKAQTCMHVFVCVCEYVLSSLCFARLFALPFVGFAFKRITPQPACSSVDVAGVAAAASEYIKHAHISV